MATVNELLQAYAPELDTVTEPRRSTIIEVAESRTGIKAWPAAIRPQAVALLAAHILTLGNRAAATPDGASAPGTSVMLEEGGLKKSFSTSASSGGSANSEQQTPYSEQLKNLKRAYIVTAQTRVG